ncbi:MAG: DNA polymerase III subunit gamma/tau [Arcobacteraceae bacterium]
MNSSDRVLALKYRPRRFEDLVGQSSVSQTLSLALDMKRLPHAYLFSGLRGSGKTSTARIMAKSLLCEHGPTSKPCEVCPNCVSSNSGRHLDVIEMDAASNRGIEDIKELIEHTKYQPSSARYKVFIIDEVHMLTTQAFNALLKTLEEPPAFVKFILATTDPLKLPATILSRTQHFRFKAIALKDIIHHIEHILNIEHITYEPKAIELIARSGHGSLRDTLTLLDQAIIYSKGHITASCVTDMLGLIDPSLMERVFEMILKKQDTLDIVSVLQDYETDLIIDEMGIYLKQQLLSKNMLFNSLIIDRFLRILGDSKHLLNLNSDGEFVLILMVSKMVEAVKLKTIDTLIKEIEKRNCEILEAPQNVVVQRVEQPQPKVVEQVAITTPKEVYEEEEIVAVNESEIGVEVAVNTQLEDNIADVVVQQPQSQEDINLKHYQNVIKTLFERSYDLGHCFEQNFLFKGFENQPRTLHIISIAEGDCKQLLWKNFAYIRTVIEDFYGVGTLIEFHKQNPEDVKKKLLDDEDSVKEELKEENYNTDEVSSMIEEEAFGSGCVADIATPQEPKMASKEMQLNELLNSAFVNKAKELFDPKRIVVRSRI